VFLNGCGGKPFFKKKKVFPRAPFPKKLLTRMLRILMVEWIFCVGD